MNEFRTLIQLIALNGKDFIRTAQEYLDALTSSNPNVNINHIQAKLIGWATLLNQQTKNFIGKFETVQSSEQFQEAVENAYSSYIVDGNENLDLSEQLVSLGHLKINRGRITIPSEARRRFNIKEGDFIETFYKQN